MFTEIPGLAGEKSYSGWLTSGAPGESGSSPAPELGKSVQSALGAVGLQMLEEITPSGRIPAVRDDVPMFGLIDNRRTYERALSISASGKYGGSSAHASWSESFASSYRSILIGYTKHIVDEHQMVLDARWSGNALKFWDEQGPEEFYRRYGDQFIDEVMFGGICSIILEFVFESEESARSFSGGFGAYGPGAGGSVKTSFSELRSVRNTQINLRGTVQGAREFPNVNYELDHRSGFIKKQPVDLGTVGEVLKFFNDFEGYVNTGEAATVIGTATRSINKVDAAPISHSISDVNDQFLTRLYQLEDARAELDRTLADARRMKDTAYVWNDEAAKTEADDVIAKLAQSAISLDRSGAALTGGKLDVFIPGKVRLPMDWFLNLPNARVHLQKTSLRAVAEIDYTFTEVDTARHYLVLSISVTDVAGISFIRVRPRVRLFGIKAGELGERVLLFDRTVEIRSRGKVVMPALVMNPTDYSAIVVRTDGGGVRLDLEVRY